jgi:hypothetical protein
MIRLLHRLRLAVTTSGASTPLQGPMEFSWGKSESLFCHSRHLYLIRHSRISGFTLKCTLALPDRPIDASLFVRYGSFLPASTPPRLTARQLPSDRGYLRQAPQRYCYSILISYNSVMPSAHFARGNTASQITAPPSWRNL